MFVVLDNRSSWKGFDASNLQAFEAVRRLKILLSKECLFYIVIVGIWVVSVHSYVDSIGYVKII